MYPVVLSKALRSAHYQVTKIVMRGEQAIHNRNERGCKEYCKLTIESIQNTENQQSKQRFNNTVARKECD